jgi:hypothetical protein
MSDGSEMWIPDCQDRLLQSQSLKDVIQAYTVFLEVCYPGHCKAFKQRLKNDPSAARAEAAVFSWLRARGFEPFINESQTRGGIDYICLPGKSDSFFIEVTSLNEDAVAIRSGWPDELTETARFFEMITPQLSSKAQKKAHQLGLAPCNIPKILTICLEHVGASALLGPLAAKWLMVSQPKIQVPIAVGEGQPAPSRLSTDLKTAAFFGFENGAIIPLRQSISAILLVAIWDNQLEVVGMLHPQPVIALNYYLFGDVPFLRVATWPIRESVIHTEWVIGRPKPSASQYSQITLTDAELRGK